MTPGWPGAGEGVPAPPNGTARSLCARQHRGGELSARDPDVDRISGAHLAGSAYDVPVGALHHGVSAVQRRLRLACATTTPRWPRRS